MFIIYFFVSWLTAITNTKPDVLLPLFFLLCLLHPVIIPVIALLHVDSGRIQVTESGFIAVSNTFQWRQVISLIFNYTVLFCFVFFIKIKILFSSKVLSVAGLKCDRVSTHMTEWMNSITVSMNGTAAVLVPKFKLMQTFPKLLLFKFTTSVLFHIRIFPPETTL